MSVRIEGEPRQARRLARRERWLAGGSPGALAARWWLRSGQWLANAPLYGLPANLKVDHTTRLLDISCRRGTLLRALDDALGCEIPPVGLDVSRAALRLAAGDERNPRRDAGLVQGEPRALPFRDGAFTLVTCGYALRHLDDVDVRALLLEVHRVLVPGGLTVLWEYGPSGNTRLDAWNARVLSAAAAGGGPEGMPRLRSSATLRRMASEAGFPFVRDACS